MKSDVVVIGGGPGGYVAAIHAAQLGKKVTLVEKKKLGGTCLNVGCIPTKALLKNAKVLNDVKKAAARGLLVEKPTVDMPAVVKMREAVSAQLVGGVGALLGANGVKVVNGEAKVLSANRLVVGDEEIEFDSLVIATGSSNFIPGVPGLDHAEICTSTEMLSQESVPESLLIIGGGVIGCEFATIYSRFGTKVTIVEMLPALMPAMDAEISSTLARSFKRDGIVVKTGCKVTAVEKIDNGFAVSISGSKDEVVEVEKVMVSVGRTPNLAGLEAVNLEKNGSYIAVNEKMQTSIPHIYAIGDVTGINQLAHVASAQGLVAAENIAGKSAKMCYDIIPNSIYIIPEIGSVGLTEAEAKATGKELTVAKFPMMACGKAVATGETDGFTKLIAEKESGKLLGCHIIGSGASYLVSEAAAVLQAGGTLEDIANTVHAHPTESETIMEAAHLALGYPIHTLK